MAIDIAKGEFLTSKLRLVQGDAFEPQTKNMDGKPLLSDDGKPYVKYFIAAAGRKGDPAVEAFKAQIEAQARKDWPALFAGPGGTCTNPGFAMKIIDGDGFDQNGKSNATKEGMAGHWVFRFSTGYPVKVYPFGKYDPMTDQLQVVNGVNPVPRGYYIRVHGWMKGNGNQKKPGMSLYHDMIEFNEVGPIIVNGPDAASVFGGGAPGPAAPAPAAPGGGFTMLPAAGNFTREQYLASGHTDESLIAGGFMVRNAPAAPAPAPAPAAPAPVPVAPHVGILNPAAPAPLAPAGSAPPPPAPAATASAAPGFKMTNPVGPSYEAYKAQGWTDALLIQNGHMVPA